MMFRTVLLAPISAASLSAAEFQFVHAGLLRNSADLARMNEAVAAREEPIFAGYEVFAPIRSRRLREPYRSRCSVHSESCREGAAARSSAGRRPHGVRNALVHSAKRPRHRAGRIRAAGCGDCGAGCGHHPAQLDPTAWRGQLHGEARDIEGQTVRAYCHEI